MTMSDAATTIKIQNYVWKYKDRLFININILTVLTFPDIVILSKVEATPSSSNHTGKTTHTATIHRPPIHDLLSHPLTTVH